MLLFVLSVCLPCLAKSKKSQPRFDGKEIGEDCELMLDTTVYHPRKLKTRREAYRIGYCMGITQAAYANASGSAFCPPDGVPYRHVFDLVVRFTKEHQDLLEKDAADVVRWALSDEYPCKDSGQ